MVNNSGSQLEGWAKCVYGQIVQQMMHAPFHYRCTQRNRVQSRVFDHFKRRYLFSMWRSKIVIHINHPLRQIDLIPWMILNLLSCCSLFRFKDKHSLNQILALRRRSNIFWELVIYLDNPLQTWPSLSILCRNFLEYRSAYNYQRIFQLNLCSDQCLTSYLRSQVQTLDSGRHRYYRQSIWGARLIESVWDLFLNIEAWWIAALSKLAVSLVKYIANDSLQDRNVRMVDLKRI